MLVGGVPSISSAIAWDGKGLLHVGVGDARRRLCQQWRLCALRSGPGPGQPRRPAPSELNAENCMQMAEASLGEPAYSRYKRMAASWLALAEEQRGLDSEPSRLIPSRRWRDATTALDARTGQRTPSARPEREQPRRHCQGSKPDCFCDPSQRKHTEASIEKGCKALQTNLIRHLSPDRERQLYSHQCEYRFWRRSRYKQ